MKKYLEYTLVVMFIVFSWILFLLLITNIKPIINSKLSTYKILFNSVEKIIPGTYVNFAGNPVGTVHKINKLPYTQANGTDDTMYTHEVIVKVDSDVAIHKHDKIYATTSGLLGERVIAIVPDHAPNNLPNPVILPGGILFAKKEDAIFDTLKQVGALAKTTKLTVQHIDDMLEDNKPMLKDILSNMFSFVHTLDGVVSKICNETDYTTSDVDDMVYNFKMLLQKLSYMITRLNSSQFVDELQTIWNTLQCFIQTVAHNVDINDVKNNLENTTQSIQQLSNAASLALNTITTILNTVGSKISSENNVCEDFLNEFELYKEITILVKDIRLLVYYVNKYGVLFYNSRPWQYERRLTTISPPPPYAPRS